MRGLLVAALSLAAAAAMACGVESPPRTPTPAASATTAPLATSTPAATSTPSGLEAADGPMASRVCTTAPWTRPTFAVMASTIANPRFGGPPRPSPELLSYYFAPVLRLAPNIASANVEPVALSGMNLGTGTSVASICPDYADAATLLFERLVLFDLAPVSVRRDGSRITVTARWAPGTTREVVFPDPPLRHEGSRGRADTGFRAAELVVTDPSGAVIFDERAGRTTAYDASGRFLFASTSLVFEPALTFTVAGGPLAVVGYTVAGRFEPGTVRLLDAGGRDVRMAAPGTPPAGWDEVLRATLAPGTYTVTGINKDPGRGGGVLIVPASTALP
ncbi:MAG: hypothetical protein U0547_12720 [Dehalococcoidia bacterium]